MNGSMSSAPGGHSNVFQCSSGDSRVADEAHSDFESELPVSLQGASEIGAFDVQPSETVQCILAHVQLTREYEVRHSVRQTESRLRDIVPSSELIRSSG